MIRTQVYITEQEKKALAQLSKETGQSQSELIRQGIDLLCQSIKGKSENRLARMRAARGIWKDRKESEFIKIRQSMERKFEGNK